MNIKSILIGILAIPTIAQLAYAAEPIAKMPLLLGSGNVPGSLALVPSVEWPTVESIANVEGNYNRASNYVGYFENNFCYRYLDDESVNKIPTVTGETLKGYFTPVQKAGANRECNTGADGKLWSGHALNWAVTQTIDPFRKSLTGGYRLVDLKNQTILQKARAGQTGGRSRTLRDNKLYELLPVAGNAADFSIPYEREDSNNRDARAKGVGFYLLGKRYQAKIEVCKSGFVEDFCHQYPQAIKPIGLIQQYSDKLRYSAFGYLNESGNQRDGGVLRAKQKYVGPEFFNFTTGRLEKNTRQEWDTDTGIFDPNPDAELFSASGEIYYENGIQHSDTEWGRPQYSGVINYINRFGETHWNALKGNDPVSELYYAALRYFRNKGNVYAFTRLTNAGQRFNWSEGFPVLKHWDDPIQYACQKNAILGIGDTNTHNDRDIPVSDDPLNIRYYTQRVISAEGSSYGLDSNWGWGNGSAYIAGMAFYAYTENIRAGENKGDQRVSTYWVDVLETGLREPRNNQYYLAAKYSNFDLATYDGSDTSLRNIATNPSKWSPEDAPYILHTGYRNTRGFYTAGDASAMVESLKDAFRNIVLSLKSTTTSLTSNSNQLTAGTYIYQTLLNTDDWSGDLLAKSIDSSVNIRTAWSAAKLLDNLPSVNSRKIFTTAWNNQGGVEFTWNALHAKQQQALNSDPQLISYLRGDHSLERSKNNPSGKFRARGSRLGDITNSDPQYMHNQNFGYASLGFKGKEYYQFRSSPAYKARAPIVAVGANDGMLHIFHAKTGKELFAYIPGQLLEKLPVLAELKYEHQYFVDGTPRIADALVGNQWKTLLIGSSGAGGRSVFALDVSNPEMMSQHSVLWEFTDPNMGYVLTQPTLVPLNNGQFGVIVSSGYGHQQSETGTVWILNPQDGSVIKKFQLNTKGGELGGVLAIDLNNNKTADRLYVADTQGNVWRINISEDKASAWSVALNNKPLFSALDRKARVQAITAPLDAAYNKDGDLILTFGTGSFYRANDGVVTDDPVIESFYAIKDQGAVVKRNDLTEQKIIAQVATNKLTGRVVSANPLKNNSKGWVLDLVYQQAQGERVISRAALGGNRVMFTTLVPSKDPCAPGGSSWIMSLDLTTGARLNYTFIDINHDGKMDDGDYVTIKDEQGNEVKVPVSGISNPDGAIKNPLLLDSRGEKNRRYLCYASSEGVDTEEGSAPKCIEVLGSNSGSNRLHWHEKTR